MNGPREFIIQRYAVGLWRQIQGRMPFIVSGLGFARWIIPGSLDRYGEHRLRPEIREFLRQNFVGISDLRPNLAELMLRESIVEALWSVDLPTCAPLAERWDRSIVQVCAEIPGGDVPLWAAEFLAGISGPDHYHSMLAMDGLRLEPASPPDRDLFGG